MSHLHVILTDSRTVAYRTCDAVRRARGVVRLDVPQDVRAQDQTGATTAYLQAVDTFRAEIINGHQPGQDTLVSQSEAQRRNDDAVTEIEQHVQALRAQGIAVVAQYVLPDSEDYELFGAGQPRSWASIKLRLAARSSSSEPLTRR